MDLSWLEMNRLESMSNGELIKLADMYGLDVSVNHQRVSIIEELVDYGKKNSAVDHAGDACEEDTACDGVTGKEDHDGDVFGASAALPKQYNISFIEVNIRDPLWVFVFWGIKSHERELHENSPDFKGYCLRAVRLAENNLQEGGVVAFSVAVGADDMSRYIGFPPGNGRFFQVELCALHGTGGAVLAVSRPFRLPRLINNLNKNCIVPGQDSDVNNAYTNPLAQLSGIENYSLTRSVDRLPRAKEA